MNVLQASEALMEDYTKFLNKPDLAIFGKALGNGYAIMQLLEKKKLWIWLIKVL